MNDLENRLMKLRKTIDQSKSDLEQAKGRKKELLRTLKENFDCDTLQEAKVKLEELQDELSSMETTIREELDKLESDVYAKAN